ncbi:MAG TPA: xylulokinase [Victivallales bacterium]|nr:xylulokinase [Victivallales bacterium]
MKSVLGIDVGTQSTKVIIYDFENKKIVAESSHSHDIISDNDGTKEQKAEWWIEAIKICLNEINSEIKKSVVAIGVSGQQHGFVPLDADGNVLYNVKLWCDTSTDKECKVITEKFGGKDKLVSEIGNEILPGYTASKILWFKNNKPELYNKMETILLPHDYINYYFTGNLDMEFGDASGTGLLNIESRTWNQEILNVIDPDRDLCSCLPELIKSYDAAGILKDDVAEDLGLNSGTIVSSGGGDNMMGAIGTGATKQGKMTASLGTSGTLFGFSKTPIIDEDLASFCSSTGGWLPLLCTMNCTVGLELTRKLLRKDLNEVNSLVKETEIGSSGIITLPFYNGERAPNFPNGKGCIMGLTPDNMSEGNLLRSSMEAAIFGLKYGLELFIKNGFIPSEITITGGGAKSSFWRQMAADILNTPIKTVEVEEAAAFGGAIQALLAYESLTENIDINDLINEHLCVDDNKKHFPNENAVKAYEPVYSKYKQYVASVTKMFE